MLTEEALILLATLAATGLLVLGVLELVWPTASRAPERLRVTPRPRSPYDHLLLPREPRPAAEAIEPFEGDAGEEPSSADTRASELTIAAGPLALLVPPGAAAPAPAGVAPPAPLDPDAAMANPEHAPFEAAPLAAPVPASSADSATSSARTDVAGEPAATIPTRVGTGNGAVDADGTIALEAAAAAPAAAPAPAPIPAPATAAASGPTPAGVRRERVHVLPIETCVAMFDEGRYAEVVSLGSAALEVHTGLASVSDRPDEAATLGALVGRAREHLGDRDGARAAYGAALRISRPSARATYVGYVTALAGAAVDAVPAAGVAVDADTATAHAREVLASAASVDDALALVPGDVALERARDAVRGAIAIACERLVDGLAPSGGGEARALVLRALADDSMPSAWRERIGAQLTPISSAEIGQLTAQAIRCVQEGRDADALEALERAERLFAALPPGAVPPERLEEFERRLWWGYTKLGISCVETERLEEAVEPLLRALALGGDDAERLRETRAALVSALEALIDEAARTRRVRGADAVSPSAIDKLEALLHDSVHRGVPEPDLASALAKISTLRRASA